MKNSLDTELIAYFRDIRATIPGSPRQKRRITTGIQESIGDYISSHPGVQMEDIYSRFGSPRDIAETYVGELSSDELRKMTSVTRKIIKIAVIAVAAAVLIWAIAVGIALNKALNDLDGTAVITVEDYGENKIIEEVNP